MEEIKKIKRTVTKKIPGAPHEIILVLDATTGQNALSQATLFNEALDITGLALTKLDGTARGGVVVALAKQFGLPIAAIGVGEVGPPVCGGGHPDGSELLWIFSVESGATQGIADAKFKLGPITAGDGWALSFRVSTFCRA